MMLLGKAPAVIDKIQGLLALLDEAYWLRA
jgi:hypothetical protein